jgi:hypothetical protein
MRKLGPVATCVALDYFGQCQLCTDRPQFARWGRISERVTYRKGGKLVRVRRANTCAGCDQDLAAILLRDDHTRGEVLSESPLTTKVSLRLNWREVALTALIG